MSGTGPVALFFGVWTKYKGIEVLLDAFALVRAELPDARLILAGAVGADLDLDGVLQRARVVGNVDARPGYVPVDGVAPLLDSARVVVTPYIRATQSGWPTWRTRSGVRWWRPRSGICRKRCRTG